MPSVNFEKTVVDCRRLDSLYRSVLLKEIDRLTFCTTDYYNRTMFRPDCFTDARTVEEEIFKLVRELIRLGQNRN